MTPVFTPQGSIGGWIFMKSYGGIAVSKMQKKKKKKKKNWRELCDAKQPSCSTELQQNM